jgi:hypothetical protein
MECEVVVDCVCPMKHKTKRYCSKSQAACTVCAEEDRQRERIRRRNERLDAERDAKRALYAQKLAEFQAEIDHEKRVLRDRREAEDSENTLEQQKLLLTNLKATTKNLENQTQSSKKPKSTAAPKPSQKTVDNKEEWSSAKKQWENLKSSDGIGNEALDTLMDMIGLEDVKDKILSIKLKVDLAVRQDVDMSTERFGASLLGNPGTGKFFLAQPVHQFLPVSRAAEIDKTCNSNLTSIIFWQYSFSNRQEFTNIVFELNSCYSKATFMVPEEQRRD